MSLCPKMQKCVLGMEGDVVWKTLFPLLPSQTSLRIQ